MAERCRVPIDREGNPCSAPRGEDDDTNARSAPRGEDDDTNAQRAKRRRAAPAPSDEAIDAADLRLLESLEGLRDFRFLARGHKGVVYVAEGAAVTRRHERDAAGHDCEVGNHGLPCAERSVRFVAGNSAMERAPENRAGARLRRRVRVRGTYPSPRGC